MIESHTLRERLCSTFCSSIEVVPAPCGLAVSTAFTDRSGDPLGFYLVEDADGYRIEDDGEYLSRLVALGVDVDVGTRSKLLDAILAQGGAVWDSDTYEIRTPSFPEEEIARRAIDFLSALIRLRDLELLTRDAVRSTFREDALAAMRLHFGRAANIGEGEPIDEALADFPADAVIRPDQGRAAAVYFVTSNEHLMEAQLLQAEAERLRRRDFAVVALIESPEFPRLSRRKFQRAQNRALVMPIFRGDEQAAMRRIAQELRLLHA
jgi:hypothetical protein